MRVIGNRTGVVQPTAAEYTVANGVTVSDGDLVKRQAGGQVTTPTPGSTGKLHGIVMGGPNDNLVSRNYRTPATTGDSGGTKKVLVQHAEDQRLELDVNGSLASDAEGQYYNLLSSAQALLTSDATAPANNDTVTIGATVYTFKTTLTGAANEVLIGASAAAALTNLKSAINATAGAGSTYGTGTVANASVTGTTLTATTLLLEAIDKTVTGSGIAVSETSTHLSFDNASLLGGTGGQTVDNLSKSATVGELLCTARIATNAAGTVFRKGRFVVAALQSQTTPV
jgi:hypothetical protein